MTDAPRRAIYRKRHRLTHALEFKAVYDAKLKAPKGPIVVFAKPNELGHLRLGLSVGKRVGNAVTRNAVKRRLRDAFRVVASERPSDQLGLDIVIAARSKKIDSPETYAELLRSAIAKLSKVIEKRGEA
ncbi:MAG: ribonuclease P protein component [Planctomycetota bacterium]